MVYLVPLEIPQNFQVDPSKAVTDKTADFLWDAVNTGPWRMQGFFRGYKVSFLLCSGPRNNLIVGHFQARNAEFSTIPKFPVVTGIAHIAVGTKINRT